MNQFLQYINRVFNRLLGEELDNKVKTYFLSGAYKSILMQGGITLLTFFTSLFIARATGDKGFGVYTTIFTWISIISVGATFGLDDLMLKKLPNYQEKKEFSKIKGLLIWANFVGLALGLLSAILLLIVATTTTIHGLSDYYSYYIWAVWVIPLFVLMHLNQAALRGLKLFGWGQFAEKIVQPFAFFLFLFAFYFFYNNYLTDKDAVIARTFSFVVTAVIALFLTLKYTKAYRRKQSVYEIIDWAKSCRYFAIASLLYIINTRIDIIILGFYQVPEEQIAYYNAALKLSEMALIPFAVLYTVTTPLFSQMYASKEMEKLQLFYTKTTRLACLIISVILLVLVIGGEWLLSLFGDNFREGYDVLLVLCLIKFIHVFVGPVNYLLMMANLEKETTWVLTISVIITILLHCWWIPIYGIMGAAYATLVGLLLFEVLISRIAIKKAGIYPTILGRFRNKI